MRLTQTPRPIQAKHAFPTTQLFILAICRVAEPIALTSIFPYSWLMVKGFHVGERNDASFYAGFLISAFALAESLTGMWWGSLSDRIGRKPVLLLGCMGTVLSLLIVGFSQSFTVALLGRLLGGALNGNIGVIQTMVGELVTRPEHEPKAYAVMPFVWSIGTIIGPAVGGTFADPVKNFPAIFPQGGLFDVFPWLLPNLICAVFMLLSIVAGYVFLEETHPDLRNDADPFVHHEVAEQTPMIAAAGATADPGVDLRQESYGTFNEVDVSKDEEWQVNSDGSEPKEMFSSGSASTKWFTWRIAMIVMSLGIYTYHAMCYDHLLPIFFQEDKADDISMSASGSLFHISGGLGLSTKTVGLVMSFNGLIALFIQAVIFPFVAEKFGVWRVFVAVTVLHPIAYFLVPYLVLLPESLLFTGIYTCLTIRNLFNILQYPVVLILLKQSSPSPSCLGKINGLAASVGAACRTISPPMAGLVYGLGLNVGFAGMAWFGAGIVALFGSAQVFLVPREKHGHTSIKSVTTCFATTNSEDELARNVIRVKVTAVDEEQQYRQQEHEV